MFIKTTIRYFPIIIYSAADTLNTIYASTATVIVIIILIVLVLVIVENIIILYSHCRTRVHCVNLHVIHNLTPSLLSLRRWRVRVFSSISMWTPRNPKCCWLGPNGSDGCSILLPCPCPWSIRLMYNKAHAITIY